MPNTLKNQKIDFETLFFKFQKGDLRAFETLLAHFKGPLYRFIGRYVPNPALADEIFQEVFLKIIKNKDQFQAHVSLKAWMYTIAKNQCLDFLRQVKAHKPPQSLDSVRPDGFGRALSETIPDPAPLSNPLNFLEADWQDQEIGQLLLALPLEQKETFLKKVMFEMNFSEIAQEMKVSENTVKSRYRYALETLRAKLKQKNLLSLIKGQEGDL